ncbi:putative AAP1-alanine/arginine aminopeptidase [Meira miltonrushii]|uniref:Aminopeptidase n=1 Tax=Meira miltonrushii TaxID=1280837 RepID=A0A316VIG3_9BASI|nr:putative AAP1-alanine/arginine aminopeptidase [Meira miltonrushii]PWN37044.1 putative AAP1-alanine/arginine aminopeptidase [Meira miltonrushii]
MSSSNAPADGSEFFRLPRNVLPTHYDLAILSDLKSLTFSGIVTATLDVHEEVDKITLNVGPKLNVGKCIVSSDALKTESKSVVALDVDSAHERATAKLAAKLPKGSKASITIAFKGEIDKSMTGYYQSSWEHEGEKGFYALTQFEPTYARRAFPSFDEPAMKATYSFTMIHRKSTVPLGNMPVTSTKDITLNEAHKLLRLQELEVKDVAAAGKTEGKTESKTETAAASSDVEGWSISTFGKTPLLSTYLVAWANGDFVHIESSYKSSDGRTVPLRVYATKEYIHQTQYTLDVTAKVLPVYEKVFAEPFMMPKCDTLIASDFDAGAMENAGLITGRTSVYLYDPAKSGLAGQKRTAGVQSHEIAHQWFGNLATLAWWTQLWLNESFATLMGESIILDMCFPEWNSASEFITNHLFRALDLDSKRSSHPIEVPLQGEDVESAINQIFDAISYAKGASVLRMLSEMIGQDVFLKGVAKYISKHKFGNAETVDLWNAITEVSGTDVSKIMESWVLKQGFPVITVTEEGDKIRVKQNRLLLDLKPEEDKTIWHIPLMLKKADGSVDKDLFLTEREQVIPKPAGDGAWKLNAGTIGVYRVAYSPEHLSKLGKEATKKDGILTLEDRVGLVSDAFVLAQAGYAKTSGALTLIKALRDDPTYLVNSALASSVGEMGSVWWEQPQDVRDAVDRFRSDVFGPSAKRLGFTFPENESPEARQLRSTVIGAAAGGGDPWVLEQMRANFAPLLKDPQDDSKIHPDLLQVTFRTMVKYGGRAEYEAVKAVYKKPATPSHKTAAMLAMGSSRDEQICRETIEFIYTDVKEQDFMYYYAALSANPASRRLILQSLQDRLEELTKRFTGGLMFVRMVEYATRSFTTQEDYDSIRKFFSTKNTKQFSTGLEQGLDAVRANAYWLKKDAEDVRSWLQANGYLK